MSESDLIHWIHQTGPRLSGVDELLAKLCPRMASIGLPVLRVWHTMIVSHPLVAATDVTWVRDSGVTKKTTPLGFFRQFRDVKELGPASFLTLGEPEWHARPEDGLSPYNVVNETFAAGATDYLCLPIVGQAETDLTVVQEIIASGRATKNLGIAAWSVALEDSTRQEQLARLRRVHAAFGTITLIFSERSFAQTVVHAYLGRDSGERVLAGSFQRGDVDIIRAAIGFFDLRNFSSIAAREAPEVVLDLLNDAFDAQVAGIEDSGGHVLKFMGDGVLAIWPDQGGPGACDRAVDGVMRIRARVDAMNERRLAVGKLKVRYGVGLHYGDVSYGNIGSTQRLDFTVIGPAVNQAANLEALGARLGTSPILSAAISKRVEMSTTSLGRHEVKGIGEVEVFALSDFQNAASEHPLSIPAAPSSEHPLSALADSSSEEPG